MKATLLCSLSLLGALTSAHSMVSLDFSAFFQEGDEFDITSGEGNSGVFLVDDFGDLTFIIPDDQEGNTVSLGTTYGGEAALELNDGDSILIQFNQDSSPADTILTPMLSFVGEGTGTYSIFDNTAESLIARIDWTGGNGGLESITFNTSPVPEPSVSLLGAIAGLALLRRRR